MAFVKLTWNIHHVGICQISRRSLWVTNLHINEMKPINIRARKLSFNG